MEEKISLFLSDYEELIREVTVNNGYSNSRILIQKIIDSQKFFEIDLTDTIFSKEERAEYQKRLKALARRLTKKELNIIKNELIEILKHSPPFTYKGGKKPPRLLEEAPPPSDEPPAKSTDTSAFNEVHELAPPDNLNSENLTISEGDKYYTVQLFFGTDRKIEDSSASIIDFNGERSSDGIKYGICHVSVPLGEKHAKGNIERPKFWKLEFHENPEKHITILDLNLKSEQEFSNLIKDFSDAVTDKDILVFIHGYNVAFADATRRAGQITFDLNFKGVSVFYSWPSDGKLKGYMGDRDDSEWSIPNLKKFLINVIEWCGFNPDRKIHIIAHSMGTYTASKAIIEVEAEYKDKITFSNIILAAPDIDKDIFTDIIAPKFLENKNRRVTLYASQKDKALWGSEVLRQHKITRAGQGGENLILMEGIDSIDASDVDTDFLGHGYFAGEPCLLNDIGKIVIENLPPEQRNLDKKIKVDRIYWEIHEE